MNYLESLNSEQKEAVLTTSGPLLILAGAGAGKTKTVTHRILHLIHQGIEPKKILAITFTNKAAKEMRERVHNLLASDPTLNKPIPFNESPFVSTFHSLGVHMLKENARLFGLTRHFSIFDRSDSVRAIKEALESAGLDPKQFEPGKILHVISHEKGNMVTQQKFQEITGSDYFSGIVANVWKKYEQILQKEQAMDFDDLLLKTALMLRDNPSVREYYQKTWTHIHIDEYQDTNKVQYMTAKLLAEKDRNLCVVGDIDQNIYSWRGADIRNILDFEKDYPDAKVITLEENYRSTQTILTTANTIIKKNKKRREKNLFTKNGQGEKIGLFEGYDEGSEAQFVASKAAQLIREGCEPKEIAVLYRANFQSRILEEAFLSLRIPYQLLGTRFFERKEVKDALSYLRAALNPESLSDIKRVINVPVRGIGKVTILKLFSGEKESISGATRDKVNDFYRILDQIRDIATKELPSNVIRTVLQTSGLEQSFKKGTEEDLERLENLRELVTLATKYDQMPIGEGIEKLLEEAALQSDQDEMAEVKEGVKLMTVHASKGLEFDYVFITGMEEDLFPHKRLDERSVSQEQSEEERRLFYVALTRARKRIFLTYTGMRTIYGSQRMNIPSGFLADIDEALIETLEHEASTKERKRVFFFDDF